MPVVLTPRRNQASRALPVSIPPNMETGYTDLTQFEKGVAVQTKPFALDFYYSQNVGPEDQPRPLDINASITIQTYTRIYDVVVDLTEGLSEDRDDAIDYTNITIGFNMPVGLSSLAGDMFIAKVGPTEVALFVVSRSREANFRETAVTQVTARVIGLLSNPNTKALINNLVLKTTKEARYNKDANELEDNGLIDASDADSLLTFNKRIDSIMHGYIKEFKDQNSDNLYLPNGDDDVIFDPNVAQYVNNVFTTYPHFKDYARQVRTLYDRMFDRDNPYDNPVHTYMEMNLVTNTWIKNHLLYTDTDRVITPSPDTKLHPTEVDKPIYESELAASLEGATDNPDDSIIGDVDTDDGSDDIRMKAVVHHTLDRWNDKVDIQLARTDGNVYPRIVRGIGNGTFNTIRIGGINQVLNIPLNLYLIENGIIVYNTIIDKNNFPEHVATLVDFPLDSDYTVDVDHTYYIEISNPHIDCGLFEFNHIEVYNNTDGNYATTPGITPILVDPIIHRNTANSLEPTTLPLARITGTIPPYVELTYNAGDVKVIRVTASNVSYTLPVDLRVEYEAGNEIYSTPLLPSSFPVGYKSTVDYILPDEVNIADGTLLKVILDSNVGEHGSLLLEKIELGLPNDLGALPEAEPLAGTIVETPVVIGEVKHITDLGIEEPTTIPEIRLNGIVPPKGTIAITEGTFDTIRIGLDNFNMSKPLTLLISDSGTLNKSFVLDETMFPQGKRTYVDLPLDAIVQAADTNPVITISNSDGLVGEVNIVTIVPDMSANLDALPPQVDLSHSLVPLVVSSIAHIDDLGAIADTTIQGIRTAGIEPPEATIEVKSGSFDTIRIKAVNKSYASPLLLKVVMNDEVKLEVALLLMDYPTEYLATKDYTLSERIDVTDLDNCVITISSNVNTVGELAFYSMELDLASNLGAPAPPVLAFETVPRCKYDNEWFWGTMRIAVEGHTQPLEGDCENITRSLIATSYLDSIKVTEPEMVISGDTVNPKAFSNLVNSSTAEDFEKITTDEFEGYIAAPINNERYLFSNEFYNGAKPVTYLEYVVKKYMDEGSVSFDEVNALAKAYHKFPPIERFYYGPLIVHLSQHVK